MGMAKATNEFEKQDMNLFENIVNLPEKEFNKIVKKLVDGKYDYQKIDKELEKIWNKIPVEDEDINVNLNVNEYDYE